MSLKTCPVCQGTKKVKGLGMMSVDCDFCDALGKIAPEKLGQAPKSGAAEPLKRSALPDNYYEEQRKEQEHKHRGANYAFKNKLNDRNVLAQKTEQITENKIAELKVQTVARDDAMLAAQKPELSQAVNDELAALEKARLEAEESSKKRQRGGNDKT